jgi:hypothetical protein
MLDGIGTEKVAVCTHIPANESRAGGQNFAPAHKARGRGWGRFIQLGPGWQVASPAESGRRGQLICTCGSMPMPRASSNCFRTKFRPSDRTATRTNHGAQPVVGVFAAAKIDEWTRHAACIFPSLTAHLAPAMLMVPCSGRHCYLPICCICRGPFLAPERNLWASPSSRNHRPRLFSPPAGACSSRPLRCKKTVHSGPVLRFGPAGSGAPDAPITVRHRRG